MKKFMLITVAGLFLLVDAAAAAAATPYIPPFDGQHKILAVDEDYYTGGVGISERAQMEDMTRGCNLKLVFDTQSGAYLSSIAVRIEDAKGHVLINTVSKGPWFDVRLPAASYRIMAAFGNRQYTRNVALTPKPQTFIFSWPVS